jgi:murein DD-endopeptidase MepM/ murein hydrolase activator NlpD
VIALLTCLACRGSCVGDAPSSPPPERGARRGTVDPLGPVALFGRPFDGDHGVANFFDHGAGERGRALTRSGAVTFGFEDHYAYDFGMPEGTPLFAMADGEVLRAGEQGPKRCPNGERVPSSVELRVLHTAPDGRSWVADYRHLSAVEVAAGQRVIAGATVARSGNTGCSSGPHLHLEILRVLDPATRESRPVDPYGWAGPGPDPWAEKTGAVSVWLWKPGEAPAITRGSVGGERRRGEKDFGPHRMVATDPVDPVDGEWVEVAVRPGAPRGMSLKGWSIANAAGEVFRIPAGELLPGESLRIWSNRAAPGPGALSWGRTTEAWDDLGDCAVLRDPDGNVRGTLAYGAADRCPG